MALKKAYIEIDLQTVVRVCRDVECDGRVVTEILADFYKNGGSTNARRNADCYVSMFNQYATDSR